MFIHKKLVGLQAIRNWLQGSCSYIDLPLVGNDLICWQNILPMPWAILSEHLSVLVEATCGHYYNLNLFILPEFCD